MNTAVNSSHIENLTNAHQATGIKVRRMDFAFDDDITEFWYNNDAFMTAFLTALSATFPEGEKQFIQSVRNYQDRITDKTLRAQIKAFIGQEAHHSKEHDALNDFMKRKGYPVGKIEAGMKNMAVFLRTRLSPSAQLANTVCAEHITAILADYYMRLDPQQLESIDARIITLWAWHAIEETEHKSVAFDVYRQTVNDDTQRRLHMVVSTLLFFGFTSVSMLQLLPKSGHLTDLKMWAKGMNYFWGTSGMVWKLLPTYLDFYKRDFHPDQHDNSIYMNAFKRKYLGETASATP